MSALKGDNFIHCIEFCLTLSQMQYFIELNVVDLVTTVPGVARTGLVLGKLCDRLQKHGINWNEDSATVCVCVHTVAQRDGS